MVTLHHPAARRAACRTATSLLLAGLCLLAAGCPASRARPAAGEGEPERVPTRLDLPAVLAALDARGGDTALASIRMTARAVVEDQLSGERQTFRASLIARLPDVLRFRASREPVGEVFSLVQLGELLTLHLPHDRLYFTGPFSTLTERAGIVRQLQPRAMLRGLDADGWLARQAPGLDWRELDAGTLEAVGPSGFDDLPWTRLVVARPSFDLLRAYLYAAPPDRTGGEGELVLSVVFDGWTTEAGPRLPARMIIALPREHARIELDRPDYLVNPALPDEAFRLAPPDGTTVHPLADLVLADPTARSGESDPGVR